MRAKQLSVLNDNSCKILFIEIVNIEPQKTYLLLFFIDLCKSTYLWNRFVLKLFRTKGDTEVQFLLHSLGFENKQYHS